MNNIFVTKIKDWGHQGISEKVQKSLPAVGRCVIRGREVVFQSSLKLLLTGNFRNDIQVKR
jgi:hypothetical protein